MATKKKPVKRKAPVKKKIERPEWWELSADKISVGTDAYREIMEKHNEFFGTQYNTHRVSPSQFRIYLKRVKAKMA